MEGGVRSEWPSARSLRDGWLLVVAILLAIQFIFAAATAVSHQLADSNSADLIEIARECSEAKECATKGGAGRLGLFSGASWERLVAFSLRRGGLGQLQFIQLGMLIVSMAITFVILRRYLGTRTAVVSLGVYLPLVFCVSEFRTLDAPNAIPLPAILYWGGILLFLEFRAAIFAVLASFALAACATIYILFLVVVPFHLGIVALWARRPLLGVAASCVAFVIPFCLDSLDAARAAAQSLFRPSAGAVAMAVGGALFVLAVRRLRRNDLLGSMSQVARIGTVMTGALLYLTLTAWVASVFFRLPVPPESRYFAPASFPLLFVSSASIPALGRRAFVVLIGVEAVALLLLPFAPEAPLSGRGPLVLIMTAFALTAAVSATIRRGMLLPPRSSFGIVLLVAFAVGVTVPDFFKPSRAEKHAFVLWEGERIVSALYGKGYTYPEVFGSLEGPAANTVLALAASLDPDLFGKPAFPVEPDFSLLLLKVPLTGAAQTKGVIAAIPVDRIRAAIVVRQDRSFVDWIRAEICRTAHGQASRPGDCIRIVPDAPLLHLGEYVAIRDTASPQSDNRVHGTEHFARPSWRWPEPGDGARPGGNTEGPLYVRIPVRTPGRGIAHVLRGGGIVPDATWRFLDVKGVEFEGDLPGAQIRFPDTHASSGVVDVEVRGIGNHPPWEWLRHFIEVTEENAHLLEQYERST